MWLRDFHIESLSLCIRKLTLMYSTNSRSMQYHKTTKWKKFLASRSNFRTSAAWVEGSIRSLEDDSFSLTFRTVGRDWKTKGDWGVCVRRQLLTRCVETFASAEQDAGGVEQRANTSAFGPSGAAGSAAGNPAGHCRRHLRSSGCLLRRHACNPPRLIGGWSAAPAFVCTSAMFPRAAGDLNLLCFVSFHHHFLVFDFYLLIYFLGGMLLLHWLMFFARNLCNTIKGIILQRVFFFFFPASALRHQTEAHAMKWMMNKSPQILLLRVLEVCTLALFLTRSIFIIDIFYRRSKLSLSTFWDKSILSADCFSFYFPLTNCTHNRCAATFGSRWSF